MRARAYIALLLLTACSSAGERAAHDALVAGNAAYRNNEFAEAATLYATAPDDRRTVYGQGNARFRLGEWTESAEQFDRAAQLSDSVQDQGRAFHNLGTTRARQAFWADSLRGRAGEVLGGITLDGDDIARKVSLMVLRDSLRNEQHRLKQLTDSALTQAESALKSALRRTPRDEDARYNLSAVQHAIAVRRAADEDANNKDPNKDKKKELSARAKLLVQQADSLVQQYRFQEALDVLQNGVRKEPSLKEEQQFMQKLDVVTKAAKAS